ncbi:MAG TPA: hypothetical protein VKK61_08975 [Tepidisphaeraceae bacterium]|nr:hypothetical protein [Tepidisphaeraceae bacterium]
MGNLWLKIKIWTKSIIFFAMLIYVILFFFENSGESVKFWYWFDHTRPTSMLVLVVVTFFAGVISTILVRTTFKTIRQIRELRQKSRLDKIEREHAQMKVKAARLQTMTAPQSQTPNDQAPMTNKIPSTNDQTEP